MATFGLKNNCRCGEVGCRGAQRLWRGGRCLPTPTALLLTNGVVDYRGKVPVRMLEIVDNSGTTLSIDA